MCCFAIAVFCVGLQVCVVCCCCVDLLCACSVGAFVVVFGLWRLFVVGLCCLFVVV